MGRALRWIATLMLLSVGACASLERPTRQMVFASAALKAATRAGAEKRAPDYYRKAENSYMSAKSAYAAREFELASNRAIEARRLAERAEYQAALREATAN